MEILVDFQMFSSIKAINIKTFATPSCTKYNSLRRMAREANYLVLRPNLKHIKTIKPSDEPAFIKTSEPIQRKSCFGFNPALSRRISLKLAPD
jgi:hypothetical protein